MKCYSTWASEPLVIGTGTQNICTAWAAALDDHLSCRDNAVLLYGRRAGDEGGDKLAHERVARIGLDEGVIVVVGHGLPLGRGLLALNDDRANHLLGQEGLRGVQG